MNKSILIFCLIFSASLLAGCKKPAEKVINQSDSVKITPLESYFSLIKPSEPTFLVLGDSAFNEYFHPAPVMNKLPLSIDFSKQQVGAIIYPETAFDLNISIDSVRRENKTMYVHYSVSEGKEQRSFTIVPVNLFAFDISPEINSVIFTNHNKQNVGEFR